VFAGSFRGKVIFENPEYINPNAVRANEKRKSAGAYDAKVASKSRHKEHKAAHVVEESELADRRVFAQPEGRERARAREDEAGGVYLGEGDAEGISGSDDDMDDAGATPEVGMGDDDEMSSDEEEDD
jgi:hypothetical protein